MGFNTFLPAGYEINQSDIEQSEAAYRLSRQRELRMAEQSENAENSPVPETAPSPEGINPGASGMPSESPASAQSQGRQFNEAISLIQKIKTRYAHEPNNATFKEFLEVLNAFRSVPGAEKDPKQQEGLKQFWIYKHTK